VADKKLSIAAIAMAHALKLKVVAEGVTTKAQLSDLKQLNCDYGRGYLFSKPIPAEEMTKLLEKDNIISL
jgi:EAL domain-containing protein (putative c-di-GMP-specific phosphodiesterase class I)